MTPSTFETSLRHIKGLGTLVGIDLRMVCRGIISRVQFQSPALGLINMRPKKWQKKSQGSRLRRGPRLEEEAQEAKVEK